MNDLKKASLIELKPDGTPKDLIGMPVQFNPATMRLQISNANEGGETRGRQARQHLGKSSTTLTVELVFDTADEGNTGTPRSVRERTSIVEKYVLPVGQGKDKQAPPKVRFHWGPFILDGVVDSINVDIDHFAADGTPLRAKVGLSIKEQDSKFEFGGAGAGANQQSAPPPGGSTGGQPGGGAVPATQSAPALGGETAADFAARVGLDPSAWRGLDIGGSASVSLDAGAEIGFSADLSVTAGIGVTAGFEAGASASLEASVGLDVSASVGISASASFSASASAGFAVAAAGGVSAAIAQVATANAAAAVQQTAQAFNQSVPSVKVSSAAAVASPPPPQLGPPAQARPPLSRNGIPGATQQAAAPSAPPLPRTDPRASSFGFGVPLRSQLGSASNDRADLALGGVRLRALIGSGYPPDTSNPSVPPWVSLPASEFAVDKAGAIQLKKRPQPSCGCFGSCRCKGGH